ncbi:acyltransferase [Methylopila turkensis]|uniref:Acyltransferase n=1 Tax=Methylopila turkensis TaxID=1437816 RepID=A0A9W6JR55_9HYPH|nr:acyltransferase [Methylopila turkensis]GLK80510.1 hypothetical protein GCM10008174_22510 [Methylopila turkensis]
MTPQAIEAAQDADLSDIVTALAGSAEAPVRRGRGGYRLPFRPSGSALPLPFVLRRGSVSFRAGDWRGALAATRVFAHRNAAGNSVVIGRNFRFDRLEVVFCGVGNSLVIGDDVNWSGAIRIRGHGVSVSIGSRCDSKEGRIVAAGASISLGTDCLIAEDVELRSSDIHRIYDRESGELLNAPAPIVIGRRTWLCGGAMVLKGVELAEGAIVGSRAVVATSVEEPRCVVAGNPARIVRRGVIWKR